MSCFRVYWPVTINIKTKESNRVHEANLIFHVAKILMDNEFACFFESPFRDTDGRNQRTDLLAISQNRNLYIEVEAKGDLSWVTAAELLHDYDKLCHLKPLDGSNSWNYNRKKNARTLGVQLCYCWGTDLAVWWEKECLHYEIPPRRTHKDWRKFREILVHSHRGTPVRLIHNQGAKSAIYQDFYALYMIYPLEYSI